MFPSAPMQHTPGIDLRSAPIDGITAPTQAHLQSVRVTAGPRSLAASEPAGGARPNPAGPSYLDGPHQRLPAVPPTGGGGPGVPTWPKAFGPYPPTPRVQ